ncbi:hypothetical protein AUC70_11820 [Methyloceanibacter stevinii]|uniref:Mor transcription activator domain-containing protein n=1 Tax=Methyloceanibacter stevinii TaxID=1774970 RepID=A0A1E3VJ60_9HYPH|nr:hypothetical protein [Methyloceanibacter stevinii]ODR93543.1 hypothetical protein AUC70_11820 [Methyloceanibacter stevinii]
MTEPAATYDYLPDVLAEIARVAGLQAAMKVAKEKGGMRVHIPGTASEGHWLTLAVGREAAESICKHFAAGQRGGGMKVDIPQGPAGLVAQRRAIADRMIAEGATTAAIVEASGYTERAVQQRKAKKRLGRDPRQQDLFLEPGPENVQG